MDTAEVLPIHPKIVLRIRNRFLYEIPIYLLYFWYLVYAGVTDIVPIYDQLDEVLFVCMLVIALGRILIFREKRLRFPVLALLVVLSLLIILGASMILRGSSFITTLQFAYLISRPFIVLLYLFNTPVHIEDIFLTIVKVSRILILFNLPMILYNLGRYNIQIFQSSYQDVVVGFFPFTNNDSLILLYTVLIFYDAYWVFVQGKTKNIPYLIFEYFFMLTTMSFKSIILVTGTLGFILIFRSKNRIYLLFLIAAIFAYPFFTLTPIILERVYRIDTSPVYISTRLLLSGEVTEFNPLFGVGPGKYASPLAFEENSKITEKYGLFEIRNYWENIYQGPTGTFSRSTSDALTLLGDTGFISLFLYILFFLWMIYRNYKFLNYSFIPMIGFASAVYALAIGFFLGQWFWGMDVFIALLAIKYTHDIK